MPPGERWTGSLLDEAQGSELTPNALEDGGGRVGVREPVLQPHAGIPKPPLVPEFRQVRRAPLRRTDFEQFGYTDICPGCANGAGRKQAVDLSEQCRSRMEAILMTTTEEHERLERARYRFAQAAKERVVEEPPQRKRHRPEGEGGSLQRHGHQGTTGKEVAAAAVRRCRLRLRHRHYFKNEVWTTKPK